MSIIVGRFMENLLGLFGIALSKRRAEKQIAEMNLPNVSGFLAV